MSKEWPWDKFPEDQSTWEACVELYEKQSESLLLAYKCLDELKKEQKKLQQQNKIMREALEHYAYTSEYTEVPEQVAVDALEKIK